MRLFVKVIPLRAGTGEPAGEARLVCCPPDVEPDTVLSFLTQQLGEVIETAWTSTEHHAPGRRLGLSRRSRRRAAPAVELACVPFIEGPGGTLQPMFEVQAGQRRQFALLAGSHGLDATVSQRPHHAYHPATSQAGQGNGTPAAQPAGPVRELDQALAAIAGQAGATLRISPSARPRRPPHGAA